MNAPVIIVGGGVIGAMSAYYLQRSGRQVTIIDQGSFAGACSQGNCGYISPSHVRPLAVPGALSSTLWTLLERNSPLKVKPSYLLKNMSWFMRFARQCNETDMNHNSAGIHTLLQASKTLYEKLVTEESIQCEWDSHGLLFVYHTQKGFEHHAKINQILADEYGVGAERWDRETLLQKEPTLNPDAVSGAYRHECDAQVRPETLLRGMRQVLERCGVKIIEQCTFDGFAHENGTVKGIRTSRGEMDASAVVLAMGAWTPKHNAELGAKVPIVPGKGYSVTMPRPEQCPTYPMLFEEHRVAISPFASGLRIGSTMQFAGYDTSTDPKRLEILYNAAKLYLPTVNTKTVQQEWWGWRPMVPDGKPIIDRTPRFKNVVVAAGHGMLGLSMGTGTGRLVSELVNEEAPTIDAKHYALGRFS